MSRHSDNAKEFLKNKKRADWQYQALTFVREKRDKIRDSVDEWEELREHAHTIKMNALENLDELWREFEKNASANGIHIHWAKDGASMNEVVADILIQAGAKNIVKSKSMLTEESHLNAHLNKQGIDVVESDLGERIIQFRNELPSHIVLPAIHLTKENVGETFHQKINTPKGESDPTRLTKAARLHLRDKFLNADAAISGVNFAIASEGSIAVSTNEGNADMGISVAPLHIACVGIDKIVPDLHSLGVFTRLLARSATGQPITTYTSHIKRPKDGKQMHIVITDNGRSQILKDARMREMLKCIRCGACLNTCPVYRSTGGHSYSHFIPGPIGLALSPHVDKDYAPDVFACTGCFSCENVCPVKVPLTHIIYDHRRDLNDREGTPLMLKTMSFVMGNRGVYDFVMKLGSKFQGFVPDFVLKQNGWTHYRGMMDIPNKGFMELYEEQERGQNNE